MIKECKVSCKDRKIVLEERKLMWEQVQKIMLCDIFTMRPEQKTYVLAMTEQILSQKTANINNGSFGGATASRGGGDSMGGGSGNIWVQYG